MLRMTIQKLKFYLFLLLSVNAIALPVPLSVAQNTFPFPINGHLKITTTISGYDSDSIFSLVDVGPYLDGQIEIRLKNTSYISNRVFLETHYESLLAGGDTRRKTNQLMDQIGIKGFSDFLPSSEVEDDHRFMDLTHILKNEDGYIAYHRLDRLALGINYPYATIIVGRQAQTWGNGMIFNPMDLFNPFSPTDIQRDYKMGDDMIAVTILSVVGGDLQALYVVRRDENHDIEWDYASLAAKYHRIFNTMEIHLMGGRHYQDNVMGMGAVGYIGGAVWRMDGTWTFLETDNQSKDEEVLFSFVANADYSWIWGGKNYYGFIEFYHNGLGRSKYLDAFCDQNIMDRISRGELFTIGRNYLSTMVQCEMHPLFNVYFTIIENIRDPSGILLPRIVWDMTQNIQVTAGATLFHGPRDTEFGGIDLPGTDMALKSADSCFIWGTWYF